MKDLVLVKRNCKGQFNLSDMNYNFPLYKPMLCPVCGVEQDSARKNSDIFPGPSYTQIGLVSYQCCHCGEHYLVVYKIDKKNNVANFGCFFPPPSRQYENDILGEISPRFIDSYNQSLRAELCGDIELASIGYRHALECLVKDYAIVELHKDRDEVVKKSLFNAISDYLNEDNLIATADVIRILGNDYAHYDRKYPELDSELLKRYMDIFIRLVETKLLIAHPPVSR